MSKQYYFTSESVSEGHPDKIADAISDVILDAILSQDIHAKVAIETLVKTGMVLVAGEVTTTAWVDIESLIRKKINAIGYINSDMGFDGNSCAVLSAIGKQSEDIALGVDISKKLELGAGDQGIMFGFATKETRELMPAPIIYAHKLMQRQAYVRHNQILPWLRPDGKSQVTFIYENDEPVAIDTIVLSTQHTKDVAQSKIVESVIEEIIKPVIPAKLITKNTKYLINPTGRFVIGGPQGDCGVTGRKTIVDSYGGTARHGGGAFSGKDPSKVDRSGAYACRYVAKNLVAAGLADKCEIQLSYAIGVAKPTSIHLETFGTNRISNEKIIDIIHSAFDLRPYGIIQTLNLLRPIYEKTAAYGHFGRDEKEFTWEKTDKVAELRDRAALPAA